MSRTLNRGQISSVSFKYKWELNDSCFECCEKVGDSVESPIFTTTNGSTTLKWRLRLYPMGKGKDYEFTPLFLILDDCSPISIHYSLALFSKSKQKIILYFEKNVQKCFEGNSSGWGVHHNYKDDFEVDEKSGRLFDNDCTILCDITIDSDIAEAESKYSIDPRLNELDYLDYLLEDLKFSDVTFKVKKRFFHVHKNILSIRSPVFEVMFKHDMKEKINNTVDIEDIEPEVFKEMLQFIYTGMVYNIGKTDTHSLLIAADKYSIEGLKSLCEDVIIDSFTLNNAVKLLKFADDYDAKKLKIQVIDFIVLSSKKMVDIPEYQAIEEFPSKLMFELFKAMALKIN